MSSSHKPKVPSSPELPIDFFGCYPGYWTELMREHNWPPGFVPADHADWGKNGIAASKRSSANRDAQLELGNTGMIAMTKAAVERAELIPMPKMMKARR